MSNSASVQLRTGATLHCGHEGDVWIALEPASGDRQVVSLAYPGAGVGGLELVVSPDERFAALFMYSGQSEQGYELFALAPLRHLGGLPYVVGEGDAPTFSPDGRWVVMAVAITPRVRGTDEYAEEVLAPNACGEIVIDWGELYLQRVPDGAIQVYPLGTPVPRAMDPDEIGAWALHDAVSFPSNDRLSVRLPWSVWVEVAFPLAESVTTPAPPG